ncbi:hypothetical protein D1BOALGB6SA_7307 [Olavius sp. associated proteobacterium Delta 1]|nr:hypothetical protein D1BOALGB6SA_7307 [Olavius sp. associated proteobacterium Delta 1]
MIVNPQLSLNCMKIGHWPNLGTKGLKDLGIDGILSILVY